MFGHPGKKLNFMGGEFGQTREWNHDHSLDWHLLDFAPHQGLQQLVRDLNRVYRSEPSLHEVDVRHEGFSWIDCNDHESSVVSFVRRSNNPADFTVFVLNFTPVIRPIYRLGVPEAGHYRELINTDAGVYGGSNVGNLGGIDTEDIPTHGYEHSVSLVLPPLACLVLKLDRGRQERPANQDV
jgi:1,4-alpha-glucan branching enzyme